MDISNLRDVAENAIKLHSGGIAIIGLSFFLLLYTCFIYFLEDSDIVDILSSWFIKLLILGWVGGLGYFLYINFGHFLLDLV